MRYLITGGCGFLGSNLADECLTRGAELFILDNLSREGAEANLGWLRGRGKFQFYQQDIREATAVERIVDSVRPDVVFHLAAQVAMTTSLADPRRDFETNVVGGINLLEALRKSAPGAILVYSSSNKVYGDLEELRYEESPTRYVASGYPRGFDESLRLDFRSPYGCSKGALDQYVLDYARVFGLRGVVFRHSTIFGGRQFATYDQGWVGWFVSQALRARDARAREPFTLSGTGKQVRDLLFASDAVSSYFAAVKNIDRTAGQAFNIGGGSSNSFSLLELFAFLERELDVPLRFERLPARLSDQRVFVADTRKAEKAFGFHAEVDKETGVREMISWVSDGR